MSAALIVDLPPMPYGDYQNHQKPIVKPCDYPPVANPIPPVPCVIADHRDTPQPWIIESGNRFKRGNDSLAVVSIQLVELLARLVGDLKRPDQVHASFVP